MLFPQVVARGLQKSGSSRICDAVGLNPPIAGTARGRQRMDSRKAVRSIMATSLGENASFFVLATQIPFKYSTMIFYMQMLQF